jgi:putative membrane protein
MEVINLGGIINAFIFSLLGIVVLLVSYLIVEKITPENTWAEIVKNQNIAVAIVVGSLILAIALIISAAIHG